MLKLEQMIVNFLNTELLRQIQVRLILEHYDEGWSARGRWMLPFGQHLGSI